MHLPNQAQIQLMCRLRVLVEAVQAQSRLDGRRRKQHTNVADMVPQRQDRAEAADRLSKHVIVLPVRLSPIRRWGSPLPPSSPGAVVHCMGIVEVSTGTHPGQQPVKGFRQRPSPARTVERLDPHARPVVEVSQRGVNFCLAMVIAARGSVPAVSARVVRVQLHTLDGVASTCRMLLVESAEKSALLMPLEERLEQCHLCEGGPRGVVVVSHELYLLAVCLPQCRQVRKQIVATTFPKGLREVSGPSRHRSEFILEG